MRLLRYAEREKHKLTVSSKKHLAAASCQVLGESIRSGNKWGKNRDVCLARLTDTAHVELPRSTKGNI